MTDGTYENDVYIEIFKKSLKCEKPLVTSCSKIPFEDQTFLKFFAAFYINKDCNCNMRIKTSLDDPMASHPLSLRIELSKEEFQAEIQPCINYLQRQRSPDLAICVLQKAVSLYNDREAVLNMLAGDYGELFEIDINDEKGFTLLCTYSKTFFFKSSWKIGFDVYIGSPFDIVEFVVSKFDLCFYDNVASYMKLLTQVALPYERKRIFWKSIMEEVLDCITKITEDEVMQYGDETISITGFTARSSQQQICSTNNAPGASFVVEVLSSDSDDDSVMVLD